MGIKQIYELLMGFFQFPNQVLALVRILRATPEEQHDALIGHIQAEQEAFQKTGRPQW